MRYTRYLAMASALFLGTVFTASALAETVKINFRDADIRSLIESVAEITGQSFVLDPRVKGKITIIAPEPIESEMLYEAVLSALQVQGFQAVNDGAIVRVVPFSQSFQIPIGAFGGELQTKVIRIDHVKAAELLPVLKPMMSKGSLLQAFAAGNNLVVTDMRSQISQIEGVIKEIDVPEQSAVEVISLSHIAAGEALHIASQMKDLQQQNLSIVEDSFNNRVIVGGSRTVRAAFRRMLKSLDVPSIQQGGVEVIYLDYSKASELKPILDAMLESETFLKSAGDGGGTSKSSYRIEVDADNNALVIAAPASVTAQLYNVVRKLDRPRAQVLIEAVIAEVSEEQANRLRVEIGGLSRYTGGFATSYGGLIQSLIGSAVAGGLSDGNLTVAEVGNLSLGVGGTIAAGDYDEASGEGFGALIDALESDTLTTVLSSPSIITLDNEEAELSVGQEVPFVTGNYSNDSGNTNPFQTIKREEVGIKLKVIPQINEGDAVRLEIEQESSSLASAATSQGTSDLVTNKRTIVTNVMVGDGELLILGGLMDDQFTNSDAKVPLLGSIPLFGKLFSSSSRKDNKRVLMMFIRPTILRSSADSTAVTEEKFRYLKIHQIGNEQTLEDVNSGILQEFDPENRSTEPDLIRPQ